jgi:competence protein ComEA
LALAFLLGTAVTLLGVNLWQSAPWAARPTEVLSAADQPRPARPQPAPPPQKATVASPPSAEASAPGSPRGKPLPAEKSIDINSAPEAGLMNLPGIGPTLAARIVEEREKGPFRSVDDLDRVAGIGPKTVAKLRPYATIGSVASTRPAD